MIFCDKRYLGLLSWHSNYQGPFSQTRFRKTISPQTPISGTKGTIIQSFHVVYCIQQSYSVIVSFCSHCSVDCLIWVEAVEKFIFCQTGMCTSVSDISQRDNMSGIHIAEGESGDKYTSFCYPGDTNQARNTCVF